MSAEADTRHRRDSTRFHGPGTVFLERDGRFVVTACSRSGSLDPNGRYPKYDIVLRRMTEDEVTVHLVINS
jgi:hypothetical protein